MCVYFIMPKCLSNLTYERPCNLQIRFEAGPAHRRVSQHKCLCCEAQFQAPSGACQAVWVVISCFWTHHIRYGTFIFERYCKSLVSLGFWPTVTVSRIEHFSQIMKSLNLGACTEGITSPLDHGSEWICCPLWSNRTECNRAVSLLEAKIVEKKVRWDWKRVRGIMKTSIVPLSYTTPHKGREVPREIHLWNTAFVVHGTYGTVRVVCGRYGMRTSWYEEIAV